MGTINRKLSRLKRKKRIRKNLQGTSERPRLSVFRSAKHTYAQIIDDAQGITLAAASSMEQSVGELLEPDSKKGKISKASIVGKLVAERAKGKGIEKVVFDRNGFMYHGRVRAVSDGARKAGLEF